MSFDRRLITCDLICLGAASPGVFRDYIKWLEGQTGRKIVSYAHRGSGEKWGSHEEQVWFSDGSAESVTTRSRVWKRLWSRYLLRPSCYSCFYHSTVRPGDLTIGDYWGIEEAHPGTRDDLGVSCLLANSALGMDVVRSLVDKVALLPSSIEKCANERQPMLRLSPALPGDRQLFWAELCESGFRLAAADAGVLGAGRFAKDAAKDLLEHAKKRAGCFAGARRREPEPDGVEWTEAGMEDGVLEFPVVFAAKHRSDEVRRKSSSGGMFYALAEYVIGQGGVVYGCAFDENLRARHVRCTTLKECERCMGSKYSQSDMGDTIPRVRTDLRDGKLVLFTGTPCQVDAVRRSSGLAGGGLLSVDLVCHGVPSPVLFSMHLSFLEGRLGLRPVSYDHRPKSKGWGHCEAVTLEDGSCLQGTRISESWKRLFYSNEFLRPSCYECPYAKTARRSDVTIADFWGIEGTGLSGFADDLGVSLVLANNERGLRVFEGLGIDSVESSLEDALPKNPMLYRPSSCEGSRSAPWELLYDWGYAALLRKRRFVKSAPRWVGSKAKRMLKGVVRG